MSKSGSDKLNKIIDSYHGCRDKVTDFADLLDSIDVSSDKKKVLWKEIYQNAVIDRENAGMLFIDAFQHMQNGTTEHVTLGSTLTKYIERMSKSNEQILRLAELIAKCEDRDGKINSDDLFSQIQE